MITDHNIEVFFIMLNHRIKLWSQSASEDLEVFTNIYNMILCHNEIYNMMLCHNEIYNMMLCHNEIYNMITMKYS